MKDRKNIVKDEFSDILKIISGEVSLREREETIQKLKEEAKEKKKTERRVKVAEKELVLEESDVPTKKVVQNIKLFEWDAPERILLKIETKQFMIILVACMVLVLYFAILGNYYLMACVISLLFFLYAASNNKPLNVKHRITTRGIDTGNKLYEWFMLNDFWFSKKDDQLFLNIGTRLRFPKGLILLLNEEDKDAIFVLLQEKVLYRDVRKQGWLDKIMNGKYISFEEV